MAGSPIDDARAAGYSDAEINDYLTPKIATAKAAGYSDDEINAHLGITPAPEKEPNFFVRYGLATPDSPVGKDGLVKVVTDMPQNIVDWFKRTPDALSQSALIHAEIEKRDKAYEEETGAKLAPLHHAPGVRELQLSDPLTMAFAPGEGLYRGFGKGGVGDIVGKPGVPQPVTIGKVPEPQDFNDAATVLAGKPAAAIESKLEQTFDEHGVHPAEVVDDASRDVTVTQDLLSSNRDVPTLYTGGKPPSPPEPPIKDVTQPEPPEPPPAGSFEDAQKQVLDRISIGETPDKQPMTWDRLYTQTVDNLNPINTAVKKSGEDLPIEVDPYKLARLTRGDAGKADRFLNFNSVDFGTLQPNGPGLKQILAPHADDLAGLDAYLASKRALDLNERRGIDAGVPLDAAQRVADEGGGKYEVAASQLVSYQNNLAKYLKDAGVLSESAYNGMIDANTHYVPFFRVMDDGAGGGAAGRGRGFGASNPIKAIKGSDKRLVDPIESIIKNTYAYISLAERNTVGINLIDMLKRGDEGATYERSLAPNEKPAEAPSTDLTALPLKDVDGEVLPPREQAALSAPGAVTVAEKVEASTPAIQRQPEPKDTVIDAEWTEVLKDMGVENPSPDLIAVIKTASAKPDGETISAFREGVRETYKVADPDLLAAYRGLDGDTANLLTRVLAAPANLLRAGSVLTPDFALRHTIRDYVYSFITSPGVFTPADMARGFWGLVTKDKDYQAWLSSGGANNTTVSLDRRYLQENLHELTSSAGLMSRAWNVASHPLDQLRMLTELAENASHLGAFKKTLAQAGVDADTAGKSDILAAGWQSRSTAIDSARIGASMKAYNMISAFANITIQDTDRVVRAFIDKPVETSAKVAGGIVVPSALLWYANHDDPRYAEIPQWEKDLFWIVMTKDHVFRVPKPFGVGVLFGSGTERMLDATLGSNPEAFKEFAKSIRDTIVPGVMPTAAGPIIDQFANRSTFTGSPLIPDRLEKQLPEYQYNPYTTETAKALGALIGAFPGMRRESLDESDHLVGGMARALTSPALIENYVRGWSGNLGNYALQLTDTALRKAGVVPDPPMPASTLADIPVVKAFVVRYPSASAQSIQDFYDQYAQNKTIYTTIQARAAEGDADAVEKLTKWAPEAMAQLDGFAAVLGTHAQIIRNIYKDPDMSPSDKRQTIDTLYFHMIELGQAGNEALKAAAKPVAR